MRTSKKRMTLETLSNQINGLEINITKKIADKIDQKIDEFAHITNKSFQAVEDRIAEVRIELNERIDDVQKSIMATHDITDAIFREMKLIREEIQTVDTREDVADLDDRVTMLEKRAGIKKLSRF